MTRFRIGTGALTLSMTAAVGVVAAALLWRPSQRRAPKDEISLNQAISKPPVDVGGLESRIRVLEMRAAASEAHVAPTTGSAPSATPSAEPSQPSREEAARQWLEQLKARNAQIASEPEDHAWSRGTTATFRREFEALGARGKFTLKDIECKTTSCLAHLSWGSYADAVNNWRSVLLAHYSTRCAKQVFVPPPTRDLVNAPYEGTVFLDCTDSRAD